MKLEELTLWRSSSTSTCRTSTSSSRKHHHGRSPSASSSSIMISTADTMDNSLSLRHSYNVVVSSNSSPVLTLSRFSKTRSTLTALLRSLISIVTLPSLPTAVPTCRWLALPTGQGPSLGRKVTGTLFGHRKGHVTFAVQGHPRADPVLLIELATSTSALVKEMSSGLVRIALECDKSSQGGSVRRLYNQPVWTMYCNGRRCGYAMSRACSDLDLHVLRTVQSVSVGAGVIPQLLDGQGKVAPEGELLYMRGRFERVVGTRDSEAFYMLNPDGNANGGPELSIFLLRL